MSHVPGTFVQARRLWSCFFPIRDSLLLAIAEPKHPLLSPKLPGPPQNPETVADNAVEQETWRLASCLQFLLAEHGGKLDRRASQRLPASYSLAFRLEPSEGDDTPFRGEVRPLTLHPPPAPVTPLRWLRRQRSQTATVVKSVWYRHAVQDCEQCGIPHSSTARRRKLIRIVIIGACSYIANPSRSVPAWVAKLEVNFRFFNYAIRMILVKELSL